MLPGAEQAAGGPSEDPGLTLAPPDPDNYLNTLWCHHPFPFCHCSHGAALPQSAEEVPCAVGFGDRKQALVGLSPEGGGGGEEEMLTSPATCQPLPTSLQQAPVWP